MAESTQKFVWSRLAAPEWEDAWRETLRYMGEARLAIVSLSGSCRIRLELYSLSAGQARDLVRRFGGRIRCQPSTSVLVRKTEAAAPIPVRGRLIIAASPIAARAARAGRGKRPIPSLVIPAGTAFGTGSHATTATCLRFLADAAAARAPLWSMLDLGTGSGILALAATRLGAGAVEGCDFDPEAIRTAKENAALNGISGVRFIRRDITKWRPRRAWDVVAANLFHSVLLKTARSIACSVAPKGALIVSGILRDQETDVRSAFRGAGMEAERVVRRGKWVTMLCLHSAHGDGAA